MADIFKEILPSILQTKKDVLIDEKDYVPFLINRALSQHYDCVLYANQMNIYSNLDKRLQYQFYLNSIRSYKRPFQKWLKRETVADLDTVKEYYNISTEKAKEALKILTDDQLNIIKQKLDKGGSDVGLKRTGGSEAK
jgi:hypothetical protein